MNACGTALRPELEREAKTVASMLNIDDPNVRQAAATKFGEQLHSMRTSSDDYLSILVRGDELYKCSTSVLPPVQLDLKR